MKSRLVIVMLLDAAIVVVVVVVVVVIVVVLAFWPRKRKMTKLFCVLCLAFFA
jgi:hypothetical protein